MMNRRDFLKLSSISASVVAIDLALPDMAFAKSDYTVEVKGFSIMQGLTNQTSTQLTIDVPKEMKVYYQFLDANTGKLFDPLYLTTANRSSSDWRVDKLAYTGLPYLGQFIFRILDTKGKVLDERNLKLLDLDKKNPRIAFLSCMLDSNNNKDIIWPRVEAADCDVLFFIGDAVYGDIIAVFNGPNLLWNRYIETRQKLPYYHWKNLKPVITVWDDHDYGSNNADGNYKHKEQSLATFRAFNAQEPIIDSFENGPGVSSFFKAFGQKFIFLDNRYFKGLEYDGIKGFLGKEQINWAFSKLSASHEPNWIIEGTQFFTRYSKSNECFILNGPEECEVFRKNVAQLNSPSVFVAGDVHFTEVTKLEKELLGYKTIEITSSSLHSIPKATLPKNPDRLQGFTKENFILIDIIPSQYDMNFEYQSVGMKKVNFKDTFSI